MMRFTAGFLILNLDAILLRGKYGAGSSQFANQWVTCCFRILAKPFLGSASHAKTVLTASD